MTNTLLFLCTGNYYRSRFAEMLFNAMAMKAELNWTAESRGLATDRVVSNAGPISSHAVRGLEARGIVPEAVRFPEQLHEQDLRSADLVIALNEREHRLLLDERFLSWSQRVEYWHVGDVGRAPVDDAMAEIEREIKRLILRLSKTGRGF